MVKVGSETAYDALQDEMPLMARIQASPGTLEVLAGSEAGGDQLLMAKRLDRLIRAGLVRKVDNRYEAVSQLLYALRQDAMVSSLTRLVLPTLTGLVAKGEGMVSQQDLDLELHEQTELRTGLVQHLLEDINELSVGPAQQKEQYTCIVIATSDVPPPGEPGERLIDTVRRAARQRATPDAAPRAILLQYDSFFSADQALLAEKLLETAAASLAPRRAGEMTKGRFTFVLGFCRNPQKIGEVK